MKRWQKIASSPEELLKWRLENTCNYCTKNIINICQEEYKPGTNQIDCRQGILEYLNQEIEENNINRNEVTPLHKQIYKLNKDALNEAIKRST